MRPWVSLLVLGLTSCAHAPIPPRDVQLRETPPPEGCERIGRVEGRAATGPLSFEDASGRAEAELRQAAADRGANVVHVDRHEEPGVTTVVLGGTAHRCPEAATP